MERLTEIPPEPAATCHIWAGLICPDDIDCLAHYHTNSLPANQLALNKAGSSVREEIWRPAWCINAMSLPLAVSNVTGSPRVYGSWLKIWIWTFPEETQVGGHLSYIKNWKNWLNDPMRHHFEERICVNISIIVRTLGNIMHPTSPVP